MSTCTNTLGAEVIVGIEAFGAFDDALNHASASSVVVSPGTTVVLSTSGVAGFSADSNLGAGGLVSKGVARALATTT